MNRRMPLFALACLWTLFLLSVQSAPLRQAQKDGASDLSAFLPNDEAKVLIMTYCTACHGGSDTRQRITSRAGADQPFWNNLVRRMITTWNAPIPDEDVEPIVSYLARHFGPSLSAAGTHAAPAPATQSRMLAVKAGLLIDGTGNQPIADAVILIEGDKVARIGTAADIPAGATVIDASSQVIIPGLIDTHVHLGEQAIIQKSPRYEDDVRTHLRQNLAFGVTTVFSLGLDRDFIYALRDRSWSGEFAGPHILTAGQGFTAPGGHPTQLKLDVPNQVDSAPEARRIVRELAARKVDGIKIWFANIPNSPNLPQIKAEVAFAIIDEAHRNGLVALAHVNTAADTKLLVQAGLDGITHIARDSFDPETLQLMKSRNVVVAPTLVQRKKALIFREESALFEDARVRAILGKDLDELREQLARTTPEEFDAMARSYEQAKQSVRQLRAAGVPLAVGTDANTAFAPPGLITHKEVEALVEAGLSPMEALVAATRGAARWAGAANRVGTIEAGKFADMLVLDGNPLQDIRNTRRIARVIIGGKVVDPLSLRADQSPDGSIRFLGR